MIRGFSRNPDRVAAVIEATARQALERRAAAAEAIAERCAAVLADAVAAGLDWPEIRPRLAAIVEPKP